MYCIYIVVNLNIYAYTYVFNIPHKSNMLSIASPFAMLLQGSQNNMLKYIWMEGTSHRL